ncbi:MAG: beta-galactosidase [Treponema sp.]|jgi:beta-galactosidase|nr:beta-galactosidase [Treponema sp.]
MTDGKSGEPGLLHGADYNYEQWLDFPEVLDQDLEYMREAGINAVSIGIFSWAMLESDEGVYHFDWLDECFERLHKNGQKVILATPSGAKPAWLSEQYPEVCQMTADGRRQPHGGRHNHCRTSKKYREACVRINTRLAERYGSHPALLLWHVSNEYNGVPCYCPHCIAAFHEWLKKRYGSLEALNAAWYTSFWSHCFTAWEQIFPNDASIHGMILDWQRFTSGQTIDFFLEETAPLRRVTPDIPITTNFQRPDVGLDYHEFARQVDIVSWDNYPRWHREASDVDEALQAAFFHDLHRSYKGKPFLMIESSPGATNWQENSKAKKSGMHILSSLQAIAHGSNSVQYFQWRQSRGGIEKFHGAVISHLGTADTGIFREVAALGSILQKLNGVVAAPVDAKAAVIYDFQSGWALDNAQLPGNVEKNYQKECMAHYGAFWRAGIPCDVIGSLDAAFEKYALIVLPMLYMLREETAARLRRYIDTGGVVAATYLTGIVNGNDLCYLGGTPGNLTDVFGLAVESTDVIAAYEKRHIVMDGKTFQALAYADALRLSGASVLAEFTESLTGFENTPANSPAITAHQYGAGTAYYLAARTGPDLLDAFYGGVCGKHGVKPCVPWEIPPGVSVQDRGGTLFVLNFTEYPVEIACKGLKYRDILNDAIICDRIMLLSLGVIIIRRYN